MPALQAEEHIHQADLLATFCQSYFTDEAAKTGNRQRKRYLARKRHIYNTVKALYSGEPVIEDEDYIKPVKKVDFSALTPEQKTDLAEWAKNIGAK